MKLNEENFILLTDSYKETHYLMYPDNTQNVYSYFESRLGAKYPYTVFFGLQIYLKKYFQGVVVTQEDINESSEFCKQHFGMDIFNRKMWERIVAVHGGKLPLRIKAAPEGLTIPINNVMVTVESTDDQCAPLTNVIETILTHLWYPSNVATISHDLKLYFQKAFETSADTFDSLPFMVHDFGFRGVSSVESAGMGAAAHLINFTGTDTIIGITYAQRYYGAGMAGFSVPASEHSVMTSMGESGEMDMVRRLIQKYPKGILSVVSDSYNIENAIRNYGTILKENILGRDGKFVVRPDSPRFAGDKSCDQILWIAQQLERYFGVNVNKKGFKILNPKVGIIYGDGLSPEEIKESIDALLKNKYSAEICVFGCGGGLLQKHNRDTQRNAFKCSAQQRDGVWYDICKTPLDSSKISKKGRLKLVWDNKKLITVPINDSRNDALQTVFENGNITKEYTWEEVKKNSKILTF